MFPTPLARGYSRLAVVGGGVALGPALAIGVSFVVTGGVLRGRYKGRPMRRPLFLAWIALLFAVHPCRGDECVPTRSVIHYAGFASGFGRILNIETNEVRMTLVFNGDRFLHGTYRCRALKSYRRPLPSCPSGPGRSEQSCPGKPGAVSGFTESFRD